MKISNICTPPLNHFIKKTLKTLFVTLLSIFLLSNTGTQVELPQSLPEVTVDANGKANMTIDIELPVSNAFQPQVQLAYNSNTQNGFFGIGWQMPSLHTISRYVNRDNNLRFFMDMNSDRKPEWVTINKDNLNKMQLSRIDINTKAVRFESTTKETSVITPAGEEKKVSTQVMEFNRNDPLELGKPAKITTYQANGNLQDEVSIQYEKVTTPNGTIAHRIKSQKDTIYENGNYFSQNTISYEYDGLPV